MVESVDAIVTHRAVGAAGGAVVAAGGAEFGGYGVSVDKKVPRGRRNSVAVLLWGALVERARCKN